MSARLRVKTRTSSPRRCTWMRAPSSLNSTDARPVTASAAVGSAAVDASIGSTGVPTARPTRSSVSAPSVRAVRAVAPRSPESMTARRTVAAGTSAALATASTRTPSSAPVRISPMRTRVTKDCSASVARAPTPRSDSDLSAADPEPVVARSSSSRASRSWTVRLGSVAGSPMSEATVR